MEVATPMFTSGCKLETCSDEMYQTLLKKTQPEMENTVKLLKEELARINVGRASTSLVEGLQVDYYGTKTPLSRMASISSPNPQTVVILAWDKNALGDIENAIRNSELGLNPINDGKSIRLNLPPLTEERRREISKIIHTRAEEAKIKIRNLRRKAWDQVQSMEKQGQITEDDKFSAKDELQKMIDKYDEQILNIAKSKEKEIMTL